MIFPITVASNIAAVWVPERLMHLVQASIAAHPSIALRLSDNTRSNGGDTGDESNACNDCRQTVKQVHEPPFAMEGDLCRELRGSVVGVVVGLGK